MAQRGFVVCRLSDGVFEFTELQSLLGKELQEKWCLHTQWFERDEQATWDRIFKSPRTLKTSATL